MKSETEDILTEKQKAFCREYLLDFNGAQAAIRAGYSENSARAIACENLTKPYLAEHINKLKQERTKQINLTVDDLLREFVSVAFSNRTDVIKIIEGDEVNLQKLKELPIEVQKSISSIERTKSGTRINFYSKLDALKELAKYLDDFYAPQKTDITSNGNTLSITMDLKKG